MASIYHVHRVDSMSRSSQVTVEGGHGGPPPQSSLFNDSASIPECVNVSARRFSRRYALSPILQNTHSGARFFPASFSRSSSHLTVHTLVTGHVVSPSVRGAGTAVTGRDSLSRVRFAARAHHACMPAHSNHLTDPFCGKASCSLRPLRMKSSIPCERGILVRPSSALADAKASLTDVPKPSAR